MYKPKTPIKMRTLSYKAIKSFSSNWKLSSIVSSAAKFSKKKYKNLMGSFKHLKTYEKVFLRTFTEINVKFPLFLAFAHMLKFTAVVIKGR